MRAPRGGARGQPQASEAMMNLIEVFSSVQGEGPEVGTSTLFVRFGECDLRCAWCDTPHSWRRAARCRFELARGSASFEERENPVPLAALLAAAERLEPSRHRWVSLTGGEPLLQPEAVAAVAAGFAGRGPGVWLETHGLHAEALRGVLPHLEVVSMDWKLASDVRRASDRRRGEIAEFHEAHEAFLAVAKRAPRVHVKLVVTPASRDEEIEEALRRIARTHPGACLVLQPVTPAGGVKQRPSAARLLALERLAAEHVADVRVIPQLHPLLGAL